MSRRGLLGAGLVALAACGSGKAPAGESVEERLPGGGTTVADASENAFGFPAANLAASRSDPFFVGNSFFKTNWVIAPASTEGRDGLGPFYNAVSCSACHLKDGRGRPPAAPDEPFLGLLIRIGRPGAGTHGAPVPDPVYGDQIQPFALPGVPPEAAPRVSYREMPGTYGDGTPYSLRRPEYALERPGYGPLPDDLLLSPRVAPAVFGMGLLENVPEARLLELTDENDADGDGISGRPNRVLDVRRQGLALGRFGWKANQPSVEQQVAGALLGDVGITSPLFPQENFTPAQTEASRRPTGGAPEIDQGKLDALTFYLKNLAVPARRTPDDPRVRRGREIFFASRCHACHVPRHVTGDDPLFPEISRQAIFPYTDLLLHDMGPELADGRPDFTAGGSEWRTPPLWGAGLVKKVSGHTFFLHDGRARDLAEAILWHGGEALKSRESFRNLGAQDRDALLAFLNDL